MFLRTHLPKIVFVLLALFLFVSVTDAAECDPCSSLNHAGGDDPCAPCPLCLSPCIETSTATVSLDDRAQYFAFPEYTTCYEAPFFSFLRPPKS